MLEYVDIYIGSGLLSVVCMSMCCAYMYCMCLALVETKFIVYFLENNLRIIIEWHVRPNGPNDPNDCFTETKEK